MIEQKYKALVIREVEGKFTGNVEEKNISGLPAGEVLINVKYSSLNYKDALSATGNKGITRQYPHTPGIDAAGVVVESSSKKFNKGDQVIVTSFDLGMNTPGGFGQYIRVPADWVINLPGLLTLKESMMFGTAGLTAAISLYRLEANGLTTQTDGEILVTGATGGVGSLSIAILSKAGYKNITAATGKTDRNSYLSKLGAKKIMHRDEVDDKSGKALLPTKWCAVIDSVGGNILATAIKSTMYGCGVAALGLTQSSVLNTTVYPFVLRGINLLGIDSVHLPLKLREQLWNKLADKWKPELLNQITEECTLEELNDKIELILRGKITGRVVVNLQ